MDTISTYQLARLDRVQAALAHQTSLMKTIIRNQEAIEVKQQEILGAIEISSKNTKTLIETSLQEMRSFKLSSMIGKTEIQWMAGVGAVIYTSQGGDILELLKLLSRIFG